MKYRLSELTKPYFKTITKLFKRKNIIDLMEKLDKPSFDASKNLKDAFYKEQASTYGF